MANTVPENIPEHVAIIMDGNGRWAQQRCLPRAMGHRAGVESARSVVQAASQAGVKYLSLFAFGQENWSRPQDEVKALFKLMSTALSKEIKQLNNFNIRLKFIGDHQNIPERLCKKMRDAEQMSQANTGMQLQILLGYSGRWDIEQAVTKMLAAQSDDPEAAADFTSYLQTAELPDPDLFIRTSGEQRLSNFYLWQLAYTELYFTPILWPDFSESDFVMALNAFAQRERRFGLISEQVN